MNITSKEVLEILPGDAISLYHIIRQMDDISKMYVSVSLCIFISGIKHKNHITARLNV